MAVYKIFPNKDSSIYSYHPTRNTGLDEILEVSTYESIDGSFESSRALIHFNSSDINYIINNVISSSNYESYFKMYLAYADNIPLDYSLVCVPIGEQWSMGTGRFANNPETTDGVCWKYKNGQINEWNINGDGNITGSYISQSIGGGTWYTSSLYRYTQSFDFNSSKDINICVTNIIKGYNTGSIENHGFMIKHSESVEFLNATPFELKYFSKDTHTIYPPQLEFKWDDSIYITGSTNIINSDKISVTFSNLSSIFNSDEVYKFNVNVKEKYPSRQFQTSSVYLNNKILPSSSYWAIKDLDSDEYIVDFDDSYTKISCNGTQSYFNIYMNGFQPERYYKVLVKSNINGSTHIFDNNYIFKISK